MILTKEDTTAKKEIGYECDVCHKQVVYKFDFLPQKNTVRWSHPSGGWEESSALEKAHVCSLECLLQYLKTVYFGAEISLSFDFLEKSRKNPIGNISKETIKLALESVERHYYQDKEDSKYSDYPRVPPFSQDEPSYKKAIKELKNYKKYLCEKE